MFEEVEEQVGRRELAYPISCTLPHPPSVPILKTKFSPAPLLPLFKLLPSSKVLQNFYTHDRMDLEL